MQNWTVPQIGIDPLSTASSHPGLKYCGKLFSHMVKNGLTLASLSCVGAHCCGATCRLFRIAWNQFLDMYLPTKKWGTNEETLAPAHF